MSRVRGPVGGRPGPALERRLLLASLRGEGLEAPEGNVRRTVTVTASRTHPESNSGHGPVMTRRLTRPANKNSGLGLAA